MFAPEAFVCATPVKVNDAQAVRDILERYDLTLEMAKVVASGEAWVLRMEGNTWPAAMKIDDKWLRCRDVEAAIARYGARHFIAFLLELAPYLLAPLTVRAIQGWDGVGPLDAREWHVEPRATEIEVNGFRDQNDRLGVG